MRLIDADALKEKLIPNCPIDEGGIPLRDFVAHTKILELYPTLTLDDIVPHGRWEWFCDKESLKEYGSDGLWGYRCSLCKAYADDYGYDSKHPDDTDETPEEHLPYCPNCGAKMDLEG